MACGAGAAFDTRVDDLDRLTERAIVAHAASRDALAATLFSRAENLASELHPDDTCLIPAWLRFWRSALLFQQGGLAREAVEGTPREAAVTKEASVLHAQAWELMQGVFAVLERRKAAGTTKYGMCRADEVAFYRRWLVASQRADNGPPLSSQTFDAYSQAVGYARTILLRVVAFMLSTVDSMLDMGTAAPHFSLAVEDSFTCITEKLLALPLQSGFLKNLRDRWTAAPFQAMLRARGLSDAQDFIQQHVERFSTRRTADIAAHGQHPCGLPSCDQREATVKQFKYCGDCEEEWYCCAEHQVLHWKEHKPICRARTAAAALTATTLG